MPSILNGITWQLCYLVMFRLVSQSSISTDDDLEHFFCIAVFIEVRSKIQEMAIRYQNKPFYSLGTSIILVSVRNKF